MPPIAVYSQPDRPAGRGRKPRIGPVKEFAVNAGLEVRQPVDFKLPESREALAELEPDLMIVVAYGLILPQQVLDIPRFGCWNIHASLLPRWRGAAPIQRAIEAGDPQTGVCIMQMGAGLDTGPVLQRATTPIGPRDTSADLHDRLAAMGAETLVSCLGDLRRGELARAVPQTEDGTVYASKISKAEAQLDWSRPAGELQRQVNAFNPWPVCWFIRDDRRYRVWQAVAIDGGEPQIAGQLTGAGPQGIDVACGQGALRILEIQAEGSRRMPADQFLNAHPWQPAKN